MSSRGFLGAGDLYIARYNPLSADYDQFEGPFEADKFEIAPKSDLKEMTSRGRTTYGQIIESVPIPKPTDFKVSLNEINRATLQIALFGTASAVNSGSGNATAEAAVAKLGRWIQLAHQNIAEAGLTVTNTDATVTYVLNTHYKINYRLGMLEAIAGVSGGMTDNEAIKVSYSYNAITGTLISGGTQTQVRAKFRLDGVNFADGLPVVVNVFEAVMSSSGAFDFLKNDFANVDLSGRLKTPVGKTEPFTVELRDLA